MDYTNNLIRLIYNGKHTKNFQLQEALEIENIANKKKKTHLSELLGCYFVIHKAIYRFLRDLE